TEELAGLTFGVLGQEPEAPGFARSLLVSSVRSSLRCSLGPDWADYCPPESGSSVLDLAAFFAGFSAAFSARAGAAAAGGGAAAGASVLEALSPPPPAPSHHGILSVLRSARVLASMTASSPRRGPRSSTRRFLVPATASAPTRCA